MNSRSALDEFGEVVIENDGHWNPSEVTDPTKLIQLQLFNITASGIGAESALKNSMEKAVTTCESNCLSSNTKYQYMVL